jgi:peptide-methionine (S)-S-oxide reductase
VISDLSSKGLWERPIVTEVTPVTEFFPAEDYHQGYYEQNPGQPYCRAVIEPKVAKFRKYYFDKLKK